MSNKINLPLTTEQLEDIIESVDMYVNLLKTLEHKPDERTSGVEELFVYLNEHQKTNENIQPEESSYIGVLNNVVNYIEDLLFNSKFHYTHLHIVRDLLMSEMISDENIQNGKG